MPRLASLVLVAAALVVAPAVSVHAAKRTLCPDGRFVQSTDILTGGSAGGAFDSITLADRMVSIGSGCPAAHARLRALKNGATRVRVAWKRCGDLRHVRLNATIGDQDGQPCQLLTGTLKARKTPKRTVSALRSVCGTPGDAACLDAPPRQWTWVPFANAHCADGSTTGIGVNPGDPGGRLLIFLNGGGACWDELTCFVVKTASYIEGGYGPTQFAADATGMLSTSFFDRNDAQNPFRNDSFVFVPYCTGDVHAGSNDAATYGTHTVHHVGFENMAAYLQKIVPTFSGASRVILSGSSAGGFGALANWWQTQQAFGALRVDLLDDSGPTLPAPYLTDALEQTWRNAWNLDAAIPPGCTECTSRIDAIVEFYGSHMPGHRAALLSYTQDAVIRAFYQLSATDMEAGLYALLAEEAPYDIWKHFVITGSTHTMLGTPDVVQSGVALRTFVTQMVTDDPAWASVQP
jgi:hypothetical protein